VIGLLLAGLAVSAGAGFLGSIAGGISRKTQAEEEQAAIRKAQALRQEYSDRSFALQKGEALSQLGTQRNRLTESLGVDLSQFNLGVQNQALQTGAAQVSMEQSIGLSQAQQGMSGTRGNAAADINNQYQRNQFDSQVALQNQANSMAVQDMGRQYSYQFDDIGREMDSWQTGGYRAETKALEDWYAGQQAGNAWSDAAMTDADWWNAAFGGFAFGASFGQSAFNFGANLNKGAV
jgi:hypothetical protein